MPDGTAALVIFDCDSTLSTVEGINELASLRGLANEISELTAAAMAGRVTLEEIYGRRLDLIRPTRGELAWLGQRYLASLVPGATQTIRILRSFGKDVHIVSGGFQQAVAVLAVGLGLASIQVHAVELYFDEDDSYAGFSRESPLARTGGKAAVCRQLISQHGDAIAVGDGMTDLEMREAGARVIGFGGAVVRPEVRERADVYVTESSLLAVLPHVLTQNELRQAGLLPGSERNGPAC